MKLSTFLKDKDLIINEKEFQELIFNRQIKVDNKVVDDPKYFLTKSSLIKIGILEVEF